MDKTTELIKYVREKYDVGLTYAFVAVVYAEDRLLRKRGRHAYALLLAMNQHKANIVGQDVLSALCAKGILKQHKEEATRDKDVMVDHFSATDAFFDELYGDQKAWANELYEAYPDYHVAVGREIPLKLFDMDDVFSRYNKFVGPDARKHRQVMETLEWAKAQDKVTFTFKDFVLSRYWDVLLRDKVNVSTRITETVI